MGEDDPYRPEGMLLRVEDSGRTWFVDEPCFAAFSYSHQCQVGDVVFLTVYEDDDTESIVALQAVQVEKTGVAFAKLRFMHELN